jgi:hypothetical protein
MSTAAGVITKFPGGIPSQEDQDAWRLEYETHVAATAYRDKRAAAYPSIGDQLDMQYHDQKDATTTWADAVAAVKAAHPKSNS